MRLSRKGSASMKWLMGMCSALSICVGHSSAGELEDAQAAYKNRSYSVALNLWKPLAERGVAAAQTGLGLLYENGLGVAKDDVTAVGWFRKAADQGDAEAESQLGSSYVLGSHGLPYDLSSGLTLLVNSANQGNIRSQQFLGELYRNGLSGVPKDLAQSVAWHRKAAELGDANSQARLALAYEYGLGVPKDIDQAASWCRRSVEQYREDAEKGDAAAQLALGLDYEMGPAGNCLAVDKAAALSWYRKAAQEDGPLRKMAESEIKRLVGSGAENSNR